MLPRITLSHDLGRLQRNLELLPKERLQAAVRAINRTMTTVRAESARTLVKEYPGVRIADMKRRLAFRRATQKEPTGWVEFSGRRFALYGNFGMRPLGKFGVRFNRLPWRIEGVGGDQVSAEILNRAFRQRGRGGRAIVMSRWTKFRQSAEVLVAPGPARAFAERGIGDAMTRLAHARFQAAFLQEAKFRLSRR